MRVFLDTNVLASAVATRGLCADLVREVLLSHTLVVSAAVLAELGRVLSTKFGAPPRVVAAVLRLLQEDAVREPPGRWPDVDLQDKHEAILAGALAGKAEGFVTGAREVLGLGALGEVRMLSPRQLWQSLTGGTQEVQPG